MVLSSALSKRYEPPKIKKISSHSKKYNKDIKEGGGGDEKNIEIQEKFNNVTMTMKFFTFIFLCGKGYILLQNLVWKYVVCIITFLVKFF